MKFIKNEKKKIIIGICLVIGICIFMWINKENNLTSFAAKITNIFSNKEEVVVKTWDVSENSDNSVMATLYESGKFVITGSGKMLDFQEEAVGWVHYKSRPYYTYKDQITNVIVEGNITNIGEGAFFDCINLTSLTVNNDMDEIAWRAFFNCQKLEQVQFKGKLVTIGIMAFEGCKKLNGITIPDSVVKIKSSAFGGNESLTSIYIPANTIDIEQGAFSGCSSLNKIEVDMNNKIYDSRDNCNAIIETQTGSLVLACSSTKIPNDITVIGEYCFSDCSNESIEIPKGVTNIGYSAFNDCKNLKNIIIPDSVTNIEAQAFAGCSSLQEVKIPDTVTMTRISSRMFSRCSSLTKVNIPNNIKSIDTQAFSGCTSLRKIEILSNVTQIDKSAFENCTSLIIYGESGSIAQQFAQENGIPFIIVKAEDKDATVPTINSVTGNPIEWTNQDVTLIVNATDSESGVATTNGYSFDNGATWQTENTKTYTENTNEIMIKVKDNVGNIATYDQIINIDKIDKIVPTIAISPNGASTSSSKNVIITVVDTGGSGLSNDSSYQYQLGTSNTVAPTGIWQNYTSGTEFTIGQGLTGDYYLWVKTVVDNAGNKSTEIDYMISDKFTFDNTVEQDTIEPTINSVTGNPTEWTNQDVTLIVNAIDNESGIATTNGYSFDNGTTWQTENTKAYSENTSGIIIKVKDNAGNIATYEETININKIDKIAPVTEVTYSTTEKTNQNVTATITANEEIQKIEGWTLSEDKLSVIKEYSVNTTEQITIKDLAGNEAKVNIVISNIETEMPPAIKKGDLNKDGKIDTTDLLQILRHMAASKDEVIKQKHPDWILAEDNLQAADINKDGTIDTTDTLKLLRHMAAEKSEEIAKKYPDWMIQ